MEETLIRRRRRELGLTLKDLSERTGYWVATLSLLDSGRMQPTPAQLAKIDSALNWFEVKRGAKHS